MKQSKRLTALFLALVLVFSSLFLTGTTSAADAETSGNTASTATEDTASGDTNLMDSLVGYYTFDETLENTASSVTNAASENAGTGSASLHGGAGETWNTAATGTAGYNSTDAVNGSAYVFSGNSAVEQLSSAAWWSNTGIGQDYALADGDTLTFTVECNSTTDAYGYAAFSVEVYDASGDYFTTGSDGNAWFAGEASGSISGTLSTLNSTVTAGTTYTITVTRSEDVFTVKYYDETAGSTFATLVGTATTEFDATAYVHVISQVGTYTVTNTTTDVSGEGLVLDVTTSEEFTVSMWVNTQQKVNYQPVFFAVSDAVNYLTAGTYYNNFASGGIAVYKDNWYWLDMNNNSSSSLKDLPMDTWTYVTISVTADGVATVYYNGEVLSTQTISGYDGTYEDLPIYLGINWWNPSFCGLMDEVTVYESALTSDEVYTLYSYDGDPAAAAEAEASGELVTTVSNVSVHDPSIVAGYVESSVTSLTSSTEIVGEADDTHTKKVYFIFGSHLAFAWSWDMIEWTTFTNNINTDYTTLFATEFEWAAKGDSSYDPSGNMWAPDVIWNESLGKWCMYMSINGNSWNSSICMLTADSLYGDWTYAGTVIYSGFTQSGTTHDYTYTDYAAVTGDTTLPSRYLSNSSTWNESYGAHAIDPCVFYDEDGKLWMSYGSWSGGIYMIRLDTETGLRDTTVTYSTVTDESDAYMGYKIAQGYWSSGEASYIQHIGDYYYLFVTYGGLTAAGGYNMRVYRATSPTGPYYDESGDCANYTYYINNTSSGYGMRLMSYYKWSYQEYAQVAQGHNSVYYDEDTGEIFLVYHTRTNDGTEGHSVRVHQMFLNEDGWLVTAPFRYTGETLSDTGYAASEIAGTYEILLQTSDIDYASLEYVEPDYITLEEDGTVYGGMAGTWSASEDSPYITMVLNGVTYKGVLLEQQKEDTAEYALTFTLVGDESNELALWGYRYSDTFVDYTVGALDSDGEPETLAWNDLSNFFAAYGTEDFTISWTFTNAALGTANYLNYNLCVTTDTSYTKTWANYDTENGGTDWCLRADYWSNAFFANSTISYTCDWDWDAFAAMMDGAMITATLTRNATVMTFTATILGSDGETYTYTATVTDAPLDDVMVYLGGENVCLNITACTVTSEHHYETTTVEATCEEDGYTTYTCIYCGDEYQGDVTEATGHDWDYDVLSDDSIVWADDYSSASITYYCKNDEAHSVTVDAEVSSESQDATCTEAGTVTYTATVTVNGVTYTSKKVVEGVVLGHDYKEVWTWTETEDDCTAVLTLTCSRCEDVQTPDVSVTSEVTAATCEEDGQVVYTATATYDGEEYSDTKTVVIPATGHDWDITEEKLEWNWSEDHTAATVTYYCKNDDTHSETVDATVIVETTDATCEEDGVVVYTATVTLEGTVYSCDYTKTIDALGHDYEKIWSWADDHSAATLNLICTRCDDTQELEATVNEETTAATCEEEGATVYTATVEYEGVEYSDTKTVVILAIGHDWDITEENLVWNWSEDHSAATVTYYCKNDETHFETVEAAVTAETTEATCEDDGEVVYTATVTLNGTNYTAEFTEIMDALGHDYDEGTVTTEPTCTEEGVMTYTCERCGGTYTEVIDALGHDYEETWTWTETEDGYAASLTLTCTRGDATLTAENTDEEPDAVSITTTTTAATCEEDGSIVYTATTTVDGVEYTDTYTVVLSAIGHDYDMDNPEWSWAADYTSATVNFTCNNDSTHVYSVEATVTMETTATCTDAGTETYTAVATVTLNGVTYTDVVTVDVDAYGHDWSEPEWSWDTDYTTATATFTCARCGDVQTVEATVITTTDGTVTTWTATVTLDGVTYTDTKTVDSSDGEDGESTTTAADEATTASEDATTAGTSTPTADISVGSWILLLVISGMFAACVAIFGRKREEEA
ncbi:MAG: family 43 glycosylhydrolase [Lachnospiraceae bacterium]|nr:family 43 glycosylhydrolase [Lachnospiraceae bacterium]